MIRRLSLLWILPWLFAVAVATPGRGQLIVSPAAGGGGGSPNAITRDPGTGALVLPAGTTLVATGGQTIDLSGCTLVLPDDVVRWDVSHNVITDGNGIFGAVVTDAVFANGGDPSVEFDGSAGYLKDDGATVLVWTYSGASVVGNFVVGSAGVDGFIVAPGFIAGDAPAGINTTDGSAAFGVNVTVGGVLECGNITVAGTVNAASFSGNGDGLEGVVHTDGGLISTDGSGALNAVSLGASSVGVGTITANGITTTDLFVQTLFSADNGLVYTDGAGNFYAESLNGFGGGLLFGGLPTTAGASGTLYRHPTTNALTVSP